MFNLSSSYIKAGCAVDNSFRKFMQEAEPIRLREPLARTLGAFEGDDDVVSYGYGDALRLVGHSCPTVTGAWLCASEALKQLYDKKGVLPVRGEIKVTVFGQPDEGALGVMAQVFTLITGAGPETGFKGLGGRFRRQNLLTFDPEKIDAQAACFRFERTDTGRSVLVRFYPWLIPFPEDRSRRLAQLMEAVITNAADAGERREFQELWMEKIYAMLIERREIDSWLKVELEKAGVAPAQSATG